LHGIGGAPIHLDVDKQFLAAFRFVDAHFAASYHRHAHAQYLPGAVVAMKIR
jgi:hypothetical protein